MASAKKTLDPLTENPKTKTDITKPFMLAYMKSVKATPEDKEWFKKIVSNPKYQKEYVNKFGGGTYTDIDIPIVRGMFCERFYPHLTVKKSKNKTFIDSIMELE